VKNINRVMVDDICIFKNENSTLNSKEKGD